MVKKNFLRYAFIALCSGTMQAEHFATLMTRVGIPPVGEFSIEKALRIYPTSQGPQNATNDQVALHNERVLRHFREQGVQMFEIIAQDTIVDATRDLKNKTVDDVVSVDINKTGGLPKRLEIFVGAKVMLRSNIDVSKKLVNGSIGFVEEIIWPHYRRSQVDAADIPRVKVNFGNDGTHIIEPKSIQFPAINGYGTVERRMLPMILSWASTVHKMQGSTVDYAVVYLGPKLFARGQAYVALSRVRSLAGLCIEELDCSKLTGTNLCNTNALLEMDRLRQFINDQNSQ